MNVQKAVMAWLISVVAKSINGTIREFFISPIIGDLPARQIGYFIGSGPGVNFNRSAENYKGK